MFDNLHDQKQAQRGFETNVANHLVLLFYFDLIQIFILKLNFLGLYIFSN